MAEKNESTKVKYTPPKDKPLTSAATVQEELEKGLDKGTTKKSGSNKSLNKIQDDLAAKKITPEKAQTKAGIKDNKVTPVSKPEVKTIKEKITKKGADTKRGKVVSEKSQITKAIQKKKTDKPKAKGKSIVVKKVVKKKVSMTGADGHTYHSEDDNATCSNCLLPKNKTTTDCFNEELFKVTKVKFDAGKIDYVNGAWVKLKETE